MASDGRAGLRVPILGVVATARSKLVTPELCPGGETFEAWKGCLDELATRGLATLRVTKQTVGKWRGRFVAKRLDGLLGELRPGAPWTVTDVHPETTPRDATHWSTRAMARQCGLSQGTVSRIWRAFSPQPHRSETFKLSPDPLCINKVRDIVGPYLNSPDKALVLHR